LQKGVISSFDRGLLLPFAHLVLVKDEANFDKFDRVFAEFFKGVETIAGIEGADVPLDWLLKQAELNLTPEEKKRDRGHGRLGKAHGDAEKAPRGAEGPPPGRQQDDRHRRHLALRRHGYNPEGVRIGQDKLAQPPRGQGLGPARVPESGRQRSNWARATSRSRCAACAASPARARRTNSTSTPPSARTAKKGYLDIAMRPERRNTVKVLMFLDIGGSMDDHVKLCQETVLGGQDRVQAPRVLLLPQLPVRLRLEGQPPPPLRSAPAPGTCSTSTAMTTR
jgi:uncharacterized protein with von Willebrand factor type A (vWA) domain